MLHAIIDKLGNPAFWIAVPQIALINILLSGDNAVVIAMACRGLPPRQRFWGVGIGAGLSASLLILFSLVVARLIGLPYVKLVGGIALLFIGAKLLVPERADRNEIEASAHLWRAVRIVILADLVMSLDNIIAVAAAARGDLVLVTISLAFSIPIVLSGAALALTLFDRLPILVWIGAALLGWIAGEVIATDPIVLRYVPDLLGAELNRHLELLASALGAVIVMIPGGLWRRHHDAADPPPSDPAAGGSG